MRHWWANLPYALVRFGMFVRSCTEVQSGHRKLRDFAGVKEIFRDDKFFRVAQQLWIILS